MLLESWNRTESCDGLIFSADLLPTNLIHTCERTSKMGAKSGRTGGLKLKPKSASTIKRYSLE